MSEVEWVNSVDLHDQVIGTVPRTELTDRGLNFRVVHVLIRSNRGMLILQRPAAMLGKDFRLGSSVAGHVRAGESYAEAARREYEEELGVPPPELEFIGTTWIDEGPRRKFIGVFLGIEARPLRPDPREVADLAEVHTSDLPAMARESGTLSPTFTKVFRFVQEQRSSWTE